VPFIKIRIVKEVIADDPAGKKASIASDVTAAIHKNTGITGGVRCRLVCWNH